ncbi:hypothetical protein GPECTOR_99g813 [Gonium pectorale]|uniref:Uncharacterized protein n=1 Tax=Gonium pectorale TaxID=33097 RepID=A0A150G022_GONPE|nr:hypothetical protein GPECTOR_99g813 [Gonium pectorale]|eukprot:KXZ43178.1 hypothetical protein GPECTOR_99g813 [Gonium pectorale]
MLRCEEPRPQGPSAARAAAGSRVLRRQGTSLQQPSARSAPCLATAAEIEHLRQQLASTQAQLESSRAVALEHERGAREATELALRLREQLEWESQQRRTAQAAAAAASKRLDEAAVLSRWQGSVITSLQNKIHTLQDQLVDGSMGLAKKDEKLQEAQRGSAVLRRQLDQVSRALVAADAEATRLAAQLAGCEGRHEVLQRATGMLLEQLEAERGWRGRRRRRCSVGGGGSPSGLFLAPFAEAEMEVECEWGHNSEVDLRPPSLCAAEAAAATPRLMWAPEEQSAAARRVHPWTASCR